jgi:hypothetical protein
MSGQMNFKDGKKLLFHLGNFCPCCGMALRGSPAGRNQKENQELTNYSVVR